jgi:hypothetical protein
MMRRDGVHSRSRSLPFALARHISPAGQLVFSAYAASGSTPIRAPSPRCPAAQRRGQCHDPARGQPRHRRPAAGLGPAVAARLVSNNRRTRARRRDRCQPPAAQAGLSRPANVAEAAAASTERARWERHIWPRAGSRSSGRGSPTRRHPHRSPPPSPSWARSGPAANPVAVPGEDPADAVLARTMDHARWIGTRWIGTCPSEADPW